ncbi:baseplate assembly protein [Roseibium algae]|uniref:Baseplate J/gp47 family protein n=1 Tax=Roseibium algae TaxID=3123038 RepID=A0ABU8TJW1_9HYPH
MTDLDQLPLPQVIESLGFETVLSDLVADAREKLASLGVDWDVGELETDPVKVVLEIAAYRETLLRARINEAARSNLLAFASGSDLDQLVAWLGVTRLEGEDDARLRLRYQLATSGRSAGGPESRYRAIALGASLDVRDVAIWRDGRDPAVRVAVLSSVGGGAPTPTLLSNVLQALNAPDVRVVSDTFVVSSAVQKTVDVVLSVRLAPDASEEILSRLKAKIALDWLTEDLLGFDLARSWIVAHAMQPGVTAVEVLEPKQDTVAQPYEAIGLGTVSIEFAGRGR